MDKEEEKVDNQQVAQQQPSHRDRLKERLMARHADKNLDNEDDFFSTINDDYEEDGKKLGEYQQRDQKMQDMFKTDGYSAAFFSSWKKGKDPVIELIRNYGPDLKEALDDPARLEEFAAANKEYADRIAESTKFEEEYKANLNASLDAMDQLKEKEGLSEDQVNLAWENLIKQAQDIIQGKISPDMIKQVLAAINHDNDVAEASETARIAGRNEKITEKLQKKNASDGTASLASGVGAKKIQARNSGEDDIFKRGGEKKLRNY